MAKLATLKDERGNLIAPRTAASAVSTASGKSVEAVLSITICHHISQSTYGSVQHKEEPKWQI